jgi:lipopolysaccharide/colanic/teichoic acid biosynthesis glycosyltransferase
MRDAFDNEGIPLPDELRLTKIGSIIRSASLDELLQLINVLKGDMSLVGPRPLLMQYLSRYSPVFSHQAFSLHIGGRHPQQQPSGAGRRLQVLAGAD